MSIFTYMSFPREADVTVLENGTVALKSYKVGELIWGDDGKSVIRNTSGMEAALVDCSKLYGEGFFHGLRVYEDANFSTFKNCFKNKYVYSLEGRLDYSGAPHSPNHTYETGAESEFIARLTRGILVNIELCRKQLRDLLIHNLRKGEFAEIYSEVVNDSDFDFGPPSNELILTTDEILFSRELCTKEKLRIEIRR